MSRHIKLSELPISQESVLNGIDLRNAHLIEMHQSVHGIVDILLRVHPTLGEKTKPKKETEMNDMTKYKNLAAILREDITTVSVKFLNAVGAQADGKEYMYKIHKTEAAKLVGNDLVVVEARDTWALARVQRIHDVCEIMPESTTLYRWVVGVVGVTSFEEQIKLEEINANRLISEHRKATRARFIAQEGVSTTKMLTELPKDAA